jgi:hypothetical protein
MGQWTKGVSGNSKGRPKGSKSKALSLRQSLVDECGDIIKVVVEQAKAGDLQAAKIILDRIMPTVRAIEPSIIIDIDLELPMMQKARLALDAGLCGAIPVAAAVSLANALAALSEKSELSDRLAAIEKAIGIGGKSE